MERSRVRWRVFGLTWLSYATYYLARKNFGVVKARLSESLGLSSLELAHIDTGYLSAYAAGQFLAGMAADRLGSRRVLGLGMVLSAAACAAFGLGSASLVFACAFAVNGLAQATGWPANVKAMAAWFEPKERGSVMGVWTTNYQVGGLVATGGATWLLTRFGWREAFWVPAAVVAAVGLLIWFWLPEPATVEAPVAKAARAWPAATLFRTPLIWTNGAAYFCLKLIRYSILFWLPFYLKTSLGYSEAAAGYLSVSFEVGGIVGAISVGWASDRLFPGRRRELSSAMTLGLAAALFLYTVVAPWGPWANFAGMALVGFCLFGPDALISGATAQDLGGTEGAATAAGAINGMGSVGAILQGYVTAAVSSRWGWGALYQVFVALAVVAAITLRLGRPLPRGDGMPGAQKQA